MVIAHNNILMERTCFISRAYQEECDDLNGTLVPSVERPASTEKQRVLRFLLYHVFVPLGSLLLGGKMAFQSSFMLTTVSRSSSPRP
jgi:hypothetical protein